MKFNIYKKTINGFDVLSDDLSEEAMYEKLNHEIFIQNTHPGNLFVTNKPGLTIFFDQLEQGT